MKDQIIVCLMAVVLSLLLFGGVYVLYHRYSDPCEAAGGVLVRAVFGWECVKGVEW